MIGNNIQAALIEVARKLMQKLESNTKESGMPSKVAARINRSTSSGSVTSTGNTYKVSVNIDMSKNGAPMAAMYEYGIDEYRIPTSGETFMTFPKERWPQYVPPPNKNKFVFFHVFHPAVEARPYIRPAIVENMPDAKKLLGKAFVQSVIVRGKETYKIQVM